MAMMTLSATSHHSASQLDGGYVRARRLIPLKTNINTPKRQGLFRFCFDRTNREVLLFPEPVADLQEVVRVEKLADGRRNL